MTDPARAQTETAAACRSSTCDILSHETPACVQLVGESAGRQGAAGEDEFGEGALGEELAEDTGETLCLPGERFLPETFRPTIPATSNSFLPCSNRPCEPCLNSSNPGWLSCLRKSTMLARGERRNVSIVCRGLKSGPQQKSTRPLLPRYTLS